MKLYSFILVCFVFVAVTGAFAAEPTQNLYKSKCQGCHGADGHASAIGKKLGARDFQDPNVAKMSDEELIKVTTEGKNKMPAYRGKLTDDQIKDLAKYIREIK